MYSATFNYEEEREYTDLTLIVEDNGIINKRRSVPTPITVRINNLDDEPTIFDQAVYSELTLNNVCQKKYSVQPSIVQTSQPGKMLLEMSNLA